MNAEYFSKILKELFEDRLNLLNDLIKSGILKFNSIYSFNSLLRCAESPTHFIGELSGSIQYKPTEKIAVTLLQGKIDKFSSTNSYFIPFSDEIYQSVINISAIGNTFQSLLLITNESYSTMQKLPFPLPKVKFNRDNGDFPLNISDDVNLLVLKDMTLIKIHDFCYYYRYIPFSIIVKKNVAKQDIKKRLETDLQLDLSVLKQNIPLNYISGINFCHSNLNTYFANQLTSMANQIIKETHIDKFLEEHKSIFSKSLGYKDVLKITFKWLERTEDEPNESKPDYILIKSDNTFDILDLKTGAIKCLSLTKGKTLKNRQQIRIRFVDYINELISQLEEYKSYFKYAKNIQFIKESYGLDVDLDNMKLIGIVGNQNNFDTNKVASALTPYKDYIKIISFLDLADMALRNN